MDEKDLSVTALTRKEAKLIRLLRMQTEERQQEVYEEVEKTYNEWKENAKSLSADEDDISGEAYWLNSGNSKKR